MITPPSRLNCAAAVHRVLRAAADLFATHGYDAVSISAIAAQAEVSKANIFHHFKSKSALYYEVLHGACASFTETLDEVEHIPTDACTQLTRFAQKRLCAYIDQPQSTRMMLRELTQDRNEPEALLVREDFRQGFTRLVELIRQGQIAGKLRADVDPAVLALLINAGNILYAQLRPAMRQIDRVDFADRPELFSGRMMNILMFGAAAGPLAS